MTTQGLPDMTKASKRANSKLQRIENARAQAEGRIPRDLHAEAVANRRKLRGSANV